MLQKKYNQAKLAASSQLTSANLKQGNKSGKQSVASIDASGEQKSKHFDKKISISEKQDSNNAL